MSFLKRVLGDPNERELKRIRPIVDEINEHEEDIQALSDDDLRARTAEFRAQLDECEDQNEQDKVLDAILPEAYAIVREASQRTIGLRHFDVQLVGGVVLHQGKIAEMGTGEGKTLVATLPTYLNALTGRGVHVITTNDYLAHRDAEWMGRVYKFLGLTVGCILSGPENQDPEMKRQNYAADITHGTNNEFGFDYLRDNMVPDIRYCVQRQMNFAIVDEVDNILIDEARTPLIISAPSVESAEMYAKFAEVVPILRIEEDYEVDEKTRTVAINDSGIDKIEHAMGIKNLYGDMDMTRYLENALKAQAVMHRDKEYIVRDGEVIIVDEHTGRLMVGRRFNEGLHQAIEAKERVKVQAENRTVATITFQNYFRLYRKLAGMTGTAMTEAQEFDKIYKLDVMVVPRHRGLVRKDETDQIYKTESAKYNAVVQDIRTRHEQGQPVLVGTTSVENSERLAVKLDRTGVPYEILNAKNHSREATIIAQAGRSSAVTISTNMAGRGTDILLGGNPDGMIDQILREWDIDLDIATEEDRADAQIEARKRCDIDRETVVELGGLHVIGTERHDSRRIDNQLRGRAGRQGDAGSSRFYVSLEDDLMRRFGAERVSKLMDFFKMEEDVPIESGMASKMIEQAQQKVETYYFDIRKHVVEYDDVIAKQREVIYADRRAVLEGKGLHERVTQLIAEQVTATVESHTTGNQPENWDLDAVVALFDHWHMPLPEDFFPENINQLKRQLFIEDCVAWALDNLEERRERLVGQFKELQGNQNIEVSDEQAQTEMYGLFANVERYQLLRVIDSLWMEHIDTLDVLRQGIGLRSIAQTDPLVEFKREAYTDFATLKEQIRHYVSEGVMAADLQLAVQAPPEPLQQIEMQTNTDDIAKATGQSKAESTPINTPKPAALGPKKPLPTAANGNKSKTPTRPNVPISQPIARANGHTNGTSPAASNTPLVPSTTNKTTPAMPNKVRPVGGPKSQPLATATMAKVGPNDPCPCGSKQKYKFCHGMGKK